MKTSYLESDVVFLLKDITGLVEPLDAKEREKLIQGGKHYSEMLPVEYVPSEAYMRIYKEALLLYAPAVAQSIARLSDKILALRGRDVVLVSLARAGTPIGILLKRYIQFRYGITAPHYSISIIRDRGIDTNAINYLVKEYNPKDLLFVDGWCGKGAIFNELKKALKEYPLISPELAVVSDPADITDLCGTHQDILIPSSCLNSTVCGLISRTFLRSDIIGANDFHGAMYYGRLKDADLSYDFIQTIQEQFSNIGEETLEEENLYFPSSTGIDEVYAIKKELNISDINFIKPGIGEATRVLLRRVPWKILVNADCKESAELKPLMRLAEEKGVEVCYYPLKHYKCCGIIKNIKDI